MKLGRFRRLGLIFLLIAIIFAIWIFCWEPSRLVVVHQTIAIHPWHPEHAGLRVAVMSDLHIGAPFKNLASLRQVVAAVNREKPDLVVILGDLVIRGIIGGSFVTPEPIADELAELHAPLGTVAVLGNHDWWYDGERVRQAMSARGIRVLENESVR